MIRDKCFRFAPGPTIDHRVHYLDRHITDAVYQNLLQSFRDFDMIHFFSHFFRFYRNNHAVRNDKELQNFINELSAKGTVPPNNGLGEVRIIFFLGGGGLSAHMYSGGQSKKLSGHPKISLQLDYNPKISAHFIEHST